MSREQDNKALVGRWFEGFWGNPYNPKIVDELAAPDMLLQYSLHKPRRGHEDVKNFMAGFREAFPDLKFGGAADLIAEGDFVVGRWEGGGTHTGPAFNDFLVGSLPAASGRKMRFTGTTVLRVANGKIAEEIGLDDGVTALQQLGLIKNFADQSCGIRNPFDVMDVPTPNDKEVLEFAAGVKLAGTSDDENSKAWMPPKASNQYGAIEGNWSCRWNGGADPTIPGDAANKWKQGQAEAKATDDRVYLLFDWDRGARRGLIDAQREGTTRLVGKYINLTDPKITRPWIGLIVSDQRIDGQWSGGRLDFRR